MRAWPGAAPRRRPGRARRRAPRRGLRLRRDAAGHSRARPTPGGRARLGGALARDRVWPRLPRPALRRDEDRLGVGRRDREPDGHRLEPRREPGRRRAVVRDHAVRDGRHGRAGAAQPERGASGSPRGAAGAVFGPAGAIAGRIAGALVGNIIDRKLFVPELPARLGPGESWRGTISAPGSLASGRWVRVAFGPLVAAGDPPDDMPSQFVWITDHAYHLRARP